MNPGITTSKDTPAGSPSSRSPRRPLVTQDALLAGNVTEDEFNWSGCGWPETMVLPGRGRDDLPITYDGQQSSRPGQRDDGGLGADAVHVLGPGAGPEERRRRARRQTHGIPSGQAPS